MTLLTNIEKQVLIETLEGLLDEAAKDKISAFAGVVVMANGAQGQLIAAAPGHVILLGAVNGLNVRLAADYLEGMMSKQAPPAIALAKKMPKSGDVL